MRKQANKAPKRKLAKKMLTKAERNAKGMKIFESVAWLKRKVFKALKNKKK